VGGRGVAELQYNQLDLQRRVARSTDVSEERRHGWASADLSAVATHIILYHENPISTVHICIMIFSGIKKQGRRDSRSEAVVPPPHPLGYQGIMGATF
jgi:hypothetical protein